MSLGDEPGYGDAPRGADRGYGGSGQTRTRLPERDGDVYGGARRGRGSSSRSLITVVGVVVLLIAAIAFANRGGDAPSSGGEGGDKAETSPTAASGDRPVDAKSAGIPSGFAHTGEGAQSAAANYAVALGSTGDVQQGRAARDRRRRLHARRRRPSCRRRSGQGVLQREVPHQASASTRTAPRRRASTFVSRIIPVGTKVTAVRRGQRHGRGLVHVALRPVRRGLDQPRHRELVHD